MISTSDIAFIINQIHEIESKSAARSADYQDRNINRIKNKFE